MRHFFSKTFGTMAMTGALLGLVVSGTGCKKLVEKIAKIDAGAGASGGSATSNDPAESADDQLREKVDEYIKNCTNNLSSRIIDSRNRYFDWVDPKVGPTNKSNVYGLYSIDPKNVTECTDAVAKAKKMPPTDAKLEAVADDYAKAVSELGQLIPVAYKYYDQKDYKDDNFAKAKELHPKLVAAFEKFGPANTALHEAIDGITKPMDLRELARIEKEEGKGFTYNRKNTLIQARTLIETSDPNGDKLAFATLEAAFTKFDTALSDLETYGTAHQADLDNPKLQKTITASTGYRQFTSAADDYRKEAKGFLRCVREAPAKAKTPDGKVDLNKLPECRDGKDITDKYNRLISTANSWQF